jgi:hypothetical protein
MHAVAGMYLDHEGHLHANNSNVRQKCCGLFVLHGSPVSRVLLSQHAPRVGLLPMADVQIHQRCRHA